MKNNAQLLGIALLMVGIPTPGCQSTNPRVGSEPVLLRVGVKVGDTFRYRGTTHMEMEKPKGVLDFEMVLTEKLISVSEARQKWQQSFSDVSVKSSGSLKEVGDVFLAMNGKTVDVVYNDRGQLIEMSIDGTKLPPDSAGTTSNITWPAEPVRIGDKWEAVVSSPPLKAKIVYTLEKESVVDGMRAYHVAGKYKPGEPMQSDPVTRFVIEKGNLRPILCEGGFTGTVQGYKMKSKFSIRRVSAQ